MLRDVTIYGTAAKASAILKRQDLAGKTGTTNEYVDAWFCGYQMTVAGCAWIGFDQPKKAGRQGNRWRRGTADLDRLHEPRIEGCSGPATPRHRKALVAFGEGRERSYIYSENVKERRPTEEAQEVAAAPLPKPDFNMPPSD
jgi:penicillin-binding protein 1A